MDLRAISLMIQSTEWADQRLTNIEMIVWLRHDARSIHSIQIIVESLYHNASTLQSEPRLVLASDSTEYSTFCVASGYSSDSCAYSKT